MLRQRETKLIKIYLLVLSCRSFSLLKAIATIFPLLLDGKRATIRDSWKSDYYKESNTEKKPGINVQNWY